MCFAPDLFSESNSVQPQQKGLWMRGSVKRGHLCVDTNAKVRNFYESWIMETFKYSACSEATAKKTKNKKKKKKKIKIK